MGTKTETAIETRRETMTRRETWARIGRNAEKKMKKKIGRNAEKKMRREVRTSQRGGRTSQKGGRMIRRDPLAIVPTIRKSYIRRTLTVQSASRQRECVFRSLPPIKCVFFSPLYGNVFAADWFLSMFVEGCVLIV